MKQFKNDLYREWFKISAICILKAQSGGRYLLIDNFLLMLIRSKKGILQLSSLLYSGIYSNYNLNTRPQTWSTAPMTLNWHTDLINQENQNIPGSTCCRSSLSDFSWATSALMQPFIEQSVACKPEMEAVRQELQIWLQCTNFNSFVQKGFKLLNARQIQPQSLASLSFLGNMENWVSNNVINKGDFCKRSLI